MTLLIDTSQETGTTALAEKGKVLFSEENNIAKEHASWLHVAIGRMLLEAKKTVHDLEAIAVIAGPGSYTGLRVGMAAAKGFCYALKIPLITQNTLRVMAESMISIAEEKGAWICPMIDARRDEVFTALYSVNGQRSTLVPRNAGVNDISANRQPRPSAWQASTINESSPNAQRPTPNDVTQLLAPQAMILDKSAFEMQLAENPILFFGTGASKWEKITNSAKAVFHPQLNAVHAFAMLSQRDFDSGNWADPIYSEPVYLKEFFSY